MQNKKDGDEHVRTQIHSQRVRISHALHQTQWPSNQRVSLQSTRSSDCIVLLRYAESSPSAEMPLSHCHQRRKRRAVQTTTTSLHGIGLLCHYGQQHLANKQRAAGRRFTLQVRSTKSQGKRKRGEEAGVPFSCA